LNGNNSGTPNPGSGASVWVTSLGQLKVGKNNSTTPAATVTSPLVISNTYLVVLAYRFQTNADEVDLWVNPTSLGNNGNVPPPTIFTTNNADSAMIQSVCLYAPSSTPIMTNLFDEIRVDTNWAGVTPNSCSPGNVYNVTGGGGPGCPGDHFAVGVSGSDLNVNYLLYTNGVFSGEVVSGTGSAVNFAPQSETALYVVLASNTLSSCVGWMNGSASVTVFDPPVITSQPNPAIVATNGLAAFSVAATGSGLHYQWYKNGTGLTDGGHISGATTPTLVIFPAGTSDAATPASGYYVVITNSCAASATSVTNALTLDAPANIVWQGGNPNTNWDVATTVNFTNSAGSPVVFNFGDNVLFDDSSTNPVVTLVGSYLSPSLVTVDCTFNNYQFTGSGAIVGPGSLVKTGFGILTNSVANTYTGGTTISNGMIFLNNSASLRSMGTGTLTLAGGTLRTGSGLGFSGPTVGVSNNINQTASSTIEYDATGSQACVMLGTLNGTAGTLLNIYHPAALGLDRIRFYGTFTNSLNIAFSSGGSVVQFAPYHSTNSQVYNGVISGVGQIVVRSGGATVLLNNSGSTFGSFPNPSDPTVIPGSVVLTTGSLGVGADSISTIPGTVDSGPIGTGPLVLAGEVPTAGGSANATLFASGATRTIHNPISYRTGTNTFTLIIGGSNNLALLGEYNLAGIDGTITNRTITVNNTALTTIAGVISDSGLGGILAKRGNGTLALTAVNTYTGETRVETGTLLVNGQLDAGGVSVTNGTLGGTGTILGPVTFPFTNLARLSPSGPNSIGTLTINNDVTFNNSGLVIDVNKSLSPSNDTAVVSGVLTNIFGSAVGVTNSGPALVVGDKFTLFNKPLQNGHTLTISGGPPGTVWNNNLEVDGSISVASFGPAPTLRFTDTVIVNETNVTFSGTSGTFGHLYYVLSTTNVALPLLSWTRESTNAFNVNGGFAITTTITPETPQKFYLLEMP
jgi:autotransporter-associated beta strand protein